MMFSVMMRFTGRSARAFVVGTVIVAMACSGKSSSTSNPTAPTAVSTSTGSGPNPAPPASGGTCRTFPTSASVTTVSSGTTLNASLTGAFDGSSNSVTVTTASANGSPCTSSVFTYSTRADFVDEVRVVPGLSLQTSVTTTNSGICGSGTVTSTYTYDSQKRLTTVTTSVGGTTTYTAWDSAGRPTVGSFPGTTISNIYNDSTRTWVQTLTSGAVASSTTTTFDANGAQLQVVNVSGGNTSTTTYTNATTAQVCK